MPLIPATKTSAPPIEPGAYPAVCSGVIDLGTQEGTFGPRHQVLIQWQIPDVRMDVQRDGRTVSVPRVVSRRFTLSLNSKSTLRPLLEAWRGRPFSEMDAATFDLFSVVGKACLLQLTNTTS